MCDVLLSPVSLVMCVEGGCGRCGCDRTVNVFCFLAALEKWKVGSRGRKRVEQMYRFLHRKIPPCLTLPIRAV